MRKRRNGRKAKSLFRYGLEIVTEFLVEGWDNYWIATLAFLSVSIPLKIRRQQVLSCTKVTAKDLLFRRFRTKITLKSTDFHIVENKPFGARVQGELV